MKVTNKMKMAAVAACMVGGYFLYAGNSGNEMNDLALINIEALAGGEGSRYYCFGDGSVECYGQYVECKIDNFRFR